MAYDNYRRETKDSAERVAYTAEEKIEYICKKEWSKFNSILDMSADKSTQEERSQMIWDWAESMVINKQERQFKRPTA